MICLRNFSARFFKSFNVLRRSLFFYRGSLGIKKKIEVILGVSGGSLLPFAISLPVAKGEDEND